jgi:acetyl esterase
VASVNLDSELLPVLDGLPHNDLFRDIAGTRAAVRRLLAAAPPPPDPQIDERDAWIPRPGGDGTGPDGVRVRIYTPTGAQGPLPAVLYVHGGAFVSGDLDTGYVNCRDICIGVRAVVVSVDYRLAPEHPFPAPLDDCWTALCWVADHVAELGADPSRIAVTGRSAGGCIAAAMVLRARDQGAPRLAYQLLQIPVLDDRARTGSSHRVTDPRVINRDAVLGMWSAYLGDTDPETPYAVPARTGDLSGLPPTYILAVENDPLRDENVDYAVRLLAAGVSTELFVVPGAFHLFEGYAPTIKLARRVTGHWISAMEAALNA